MTGALDGMTVIAVEQAVAAPFATRQLADLGARVIKVERVNVGDFARDYDHVVRGMSSHFVWLNRNKESICLDLKDPSGRTVLEQLVAKADVFIQNLAPGALERLGFGAAALRARYQDLVYCSISGYGASGPFRNRKAYDLLVQCEAGLLSLTGSEEEPAKVGIPVADIAAGMYAYSGVLSALLRRARSGIGATIEISMLEALAEWMGFPIYFTRYGGTQPPRSGASHPVIAPYGPYRCADGETVFVAVQNERDWLAFCREVLCDPAVADVEHFARNTERVANREALAATIDAMLSTIDCAELELRLERAGIAHARLRTVQELIEHPQLSGRWREVGSPVGSLAALLPPVQLDGDETPFGPVPAPGQHTEAIMHEFGLAETVR
jgi:itaconate CoA-transferase